MPFARSWQRELDRTGSSPAAASPSPIDLELLVRLVFDNAAGGAIPFDVQADAVAAVERHVRLLAGRPVNAAERVKIGIAVALEWNRRAASWFTTSDGRYFANDGDRRAHQRMLDERAARLAARVAEQRNAENERYARRSA